MNEINYMTANYAPKAYRLQATNSSARSLVSIEQSQGFQTVAVNPKEMQ